MNIIELNDKIKINKDSNSILYKSFNDKTHTEVNLDNIDNYGKIRIVLKTKKISNFPIIFDFYSSDELNNIATSVDKNIELLDLIDLITYKQEKITYQLLDENKNLSSLFALIDKDRLLELDLLSPKKWVYNNKYIYDSAVPFIFYKKEHFNMLKSFDEKTVSFLVKNNLKLLFEDENFDDINLCKLNFKIVQFMRVISLLKPELNKLHKINADYVYKVIFILYLSFDMTNISKINEKDLYILNLQYICKIIFNDIISSNILRNFNVFSHIDASIVDFKYSYNVFLKNSKLRKITNVSFNDVEFANSKILFYSKILRLYSISYLEPNKYNNNELKNLSKNTPSLLRLYTNSLYEIEIKSKKNITCFITDILRKNNVITLFDSPFFVDNYLFIPLTKEFMFEIESMFMKNCVRTKHNFCTYEYFNEHKVCNLFFHVFKFNYISEELKKVALDYFKNIDEIDINDFYKRFYKNNLISYSYHVSSNQEKSKYDENNYISSSLSSLKENVNFQFREVKQKNNRTITGVADEIMFNCVFLNYLNNFINDNIDEIIKKIYK